MFRDFRHETHFSAEPDQAHPSARLSGSHGDQGWTQGDQPAPRQGPKEALRLSRPSPAVPPPVAFLRRRAEYLALRDATGAPTRSFLALKRNRADQDPAVRFGFTVTRRIGKAVKRNRIRRRLREAARSVAPRYGEPGCDYVLIARAAAFDRSWADLLDDLRRALLSLARNPT